MKKDQENTRISKTALLVLVFGFGFVIYAAWKNAAAHESATKNNGVKNINTEQANSVNSKNTNTALQDAGENGKNSNTGAQNSNTAPEATGGQPLNIYVADRAGFQIENETGKAVQPTTEGDMTVFEFSTGSVTVTTTENKGLIEESFGVVAEEEIAIAGKKGRKIVGASPKDGTKITYILLENAEKLYVLKGSDVFLTTTVPSTFTFIK